MLSQTLMRLSLLGSPKERLHQDEKESFQLKHKEILSKLKETSQGRKTGTDGKPKGDPSKEAQEVLKAEVFLFSSNLNLTCLHNFSF